MNIKSIKLRMKYLITICVLIGTFTSSLIAESIYITGKLNLIVGEDYSPSSKKMVETQNIYSIETKGREIYTLDINNSSSAMLNSYINREVNVEIDSNNKVYKEDSTYKKYKLLKIALTENNISKKKPPQNKFKKPWINLLCKFADKPNVSLTPTQIQKMFSNKYGYLEHYWRETTYGQVDINGTQTIDHWVTLPHNHDYYSSLPISLMLLRLNDDCLAASSSLYNKTSYGGYNMFFNSHIDDGKSYGSIGRNHTWIQVNHTSRLAVIAHEMGHGFGLYHATVLGASNDYASVWSLMSYTKTDKDIDIYVDIPQHTIAYHKQRLGAIDSKYIYNYNQNEDSIATDIHINRVETLPENNNSYLIAHVYSADKSKHYTIEVRDNTLEEYDSSLPAKGILIHKILDSENKALIISKDYNGNGSYKGKHWVSGEKFLDLDNNIQIEVLKETGAGYDVRIYPTIAILPPSDIQVNVVAKNSISILWKDNSNNEDGFKIYYDNKLIATLDTNKTKYTYTIDNPFEGDKHVIKIEAYNNSYISYPLVTTFSAKAAFITSPKNATTSLSNKSITINWERGMANNIRLSVTSYTNGKETVISKIDNIEDTNYTFITPNIFEEVLIGLESFDTNNSSIGSSKVHLYSYYTIPNKPTDFKTTSVTANNAELTWSDNSNDESGFRIYNFEELIKTVDANTTSTTLDNLIKNTTYRLEIKAYNLSGESNASLLKLTTPDIDNILPTTPTNFKESNVTKTTAILTWDQNSDDIDGYKIYHEGELLPITLDKNSTSYTLSNLSENREYTYSLRAYNGAGESNATVITFKTLKAIIETPVNLVVSDTTQTTAKLTWDSSDSYKIGYKVYENNTTLVATLSASATSYDITGLTPSSEYIYSVIAYDKERVSDSISVSFKTLDINISKSIIMSPKNGDTVKAGDSLTVTWRNSGAPKVFLYIPGIYFGFVEDTSKTLKIPVKKKGKLFITLFSEIDNNWEYDRITIKVKRDILKLPAPTNLVASNITKHSVKLTWNDNAKNETGYKIKCRRVRKIELPENAESYTIRRLRANTQYRCKVRAFNGKVKSKPAIISFKTTDSNTSKSTIISPKNRDTVKAGEILTIIWKNRGAKKVYLSVPGIYSGFVTGTNKVLKIPEKKKGKVFVTLYSKINHKWKSDKVILTIE